MPNNQDIEQRKQEFVDAAEKLFKKNGIVDTTISAIVKEMDVAKGLFYYYFNSKDDVIDAISERYNQDFVKTIRRAMNTDDFESRMDQFIENTIVSFRNLWVNLHGDTDNIDLSILTSRSLDEAKKTASEALRELLEEGKKLQKLDIEQTKYYADMIIGGICDLVAQSETDLEEIKKMIKKILK